MKSCPIRNDISLGVYNILGIKLFDFKTEALGNVIKMNFQGYSHGIYFIVVNPYNIVKSICF
ncbi:hypothetical protein ACFLSQ_08045 [Bacteroidota bacterium]